MSRIGKKPVPVPANVTVTIDGQNIVVKGPKGTLSLVLVEEVRAEMTPEGVLISPLEKNQRGRAMWGLSRTLVNNLIVGVTTGYEKKLEITGVGYRAAAQGQVVSLSLGFSHEVNYQVPEGITVTTPKPTEIVVVGIDKQVVGQVSAEIRAYRQPEPYKGKGVRYAGEFIPRKAGKKK